MYYLRIINKINKLASHEEAKVAWLKNDKCTSTFLFNLCGKCNLKPEDNNLSVYRTDGSEEEVLRIAVAFEISTGWVKNGHTVGYCLLSNEDLGRNNIVAVNDKISNTPLREVNDLHCNLVELDSNKFAEIANLIYKSKKVPIAATKCQQEITKMLQKKRFDNIENTTQKHYGEEISKHS